MAKKTKSSLSTSSAWKVEYIVRGRGTDSHKAEIFITLNNESTSLTTDVLDAMGFIVFGYEGQQKCDIISASYLGRCLS